MLTFLGGNGKVLRILPSEKEIGKELEVMGRINVVVARICEFVLGH